MLHSRLSSRARAILCAIALASAPALLALPAHARSPRAWPVLGVRAGQAPWESAGVSSYSAMLEQCVASAASQGRSVTFTGQMVAVSGSQRMGMRIVLQERIGGEADFHDVNAPGLGVWSYSESGVRIYRYVKQITNLSAPAVYRALVRYRWVGERGHVLRRASLRTATCAQPLVSSSGVPAPTKA